MTRKVVLNMSRKIVSGKVVSNTRPIVVFRRIFLLLFPRTRSIRPKIPVLITEMFVCRMERILPPLRNRTHKTTLGGMGARSARPMCTLLTHVKKLHCYSNSKNTPRPDT